MANLTVSRLSQCDPAAWTALVQAQPEWARATVRRVKARSMQRGWSDAALVRYEAVLDNGPVLTFVGKRISDNETRALVVLGNRPPVDVPRVYLAQRSLCVMEALPPAKPPAEWTMEDACAALTNLAHLHAAFWECAPDGLDQLDAAGFGRRLDKAAHGLELIERVGGWPGLFEPSLMRAMRRVLQNRERYITPLTGQPFTLLHGDAWMPNWHITGNRCALLDWDGATVGPAAWDVSYFLEIAAVYKAANGQWQVCRPPIARDEAVTFYLERLESALVRHVDRVAFQAALEAAFVVNTLTLWLGLAEETGLLTNVLVGVGRLAARLPEGLRHTLEQLMLSNQGDFMRQTFARFESLVAASQ